MASGFGYNGGRGRCFNFWQEFNKCYAMADAPQDCIAQRDDYLECLHHTKENMLQMPKLGNYFGQTEENPF
ncbi:hypothetical protein K450DRAFT_261893 [Umbelopsis ramanniana AG]|uniref:NADH dehydrogenase [ubiquinone] iron-sulfur protein 5 n=1 Tax=Umbelopsis ramanniana AG TaxID=1314678 RepID=A0AAD5E263_UMBRA|nr:uncharacterized protein K450DRAFT_261893 [Umbelopsis ramanniana AG]KAI8575409.1 hypothetical protein K450DRAFT_261893 [Umbelopsis ramanniana AG]